MQQALKEEKLKEEWEKKMWKYSQKSEFSFSGKQISTVISSRLCYLNIDVMHAVCINSCL